MNNLETGNIKEMVKMQWKKPKVIVLDIKGTSSSSDNFYDDGLDGFQS